MRPKLIMFCYFIFILGTLFSLMIEGTWLGSEEVTFVNQMTGLTSLEIQGAGIWQVPKQIGGFITNGLPKLITWNYSYLDDGYAALFKWVFLYAISAGVVWGVVLVFIPIVQGLISGIRGLLPF